MSGDNQAVDEQKAIGSEKEAPVSATEREEEKAAEEYNQQDKNNDMMHVRVAAPFREYYDGQAFSISAVNLTGPFDILPKHHNFISLLTACELVIRGLVKTEQKAIKITISGGIMHVKEDEVIVFLDV
ncbi:MAG TPA: hypothetical protein VFN31_03440 [Candidatus Saccharimonadales bacterium]|nr:hypothetical protein [Candidatus Saccharimonadales bacterium]